MRRTILPALFLILLFPLTSRAQQTSAPQVHKVSASGSSSTQPAMTPLQMAELRADILMARKMYPEAIAAYERLVKQEPKNAVVLNQLGVAYEQLSQYGPAERYFKKAIKADKTYVSAYNNVGTVEYSKRHYKNAIKWYEKTLKLRADMATVYSNLGYAYFNEKQYPEAVASFRTAIQIDPHSFQETGQSNGTIVQPRGVTDPGLFYFFVARTYAQLGNAERAAHYLKMARDDGYEKFVSAKTDPAFAKVIKDPQVIAVFAPVPELADKRR
ncbi:MAG: tetratricopeptide repeat protein [Candidatus Acidiferrales bacterium]